MTKRVTKRKRPETRDQKFRRLMARIVRCLPITAAEARFVWDEYSRRHRANLQEAV